MNLTQHFCFFLQKIVEDFLSKCEDIVNMNKNTYFHHIFFIPSKCPEYHIIVRKVEFKLLAWRFDYIRQKLLLLRLRKNFFVKHSEVINKISLMEELRKLVLSAVTYCELIRQ